jgi:hypothetical protein
MSAEIAHELHGEKSEERAASRSPRARLVLALGPVAVLAGVAWALLQPWRLTLLHPHGQGFWWLLSEPPLFVVVAGLLFHRFVARGLLEDLERMEG